MALNPYNQILDLLEDKWDITNTDGRTPSFTKLTDKKKIDYRVNKDWIIMTIAKPRRDAGGVGYVVYNRYDNFFLDIRCLDTEEHHANMVAEVERILEENFNLFADTTNDYHLIESDGDRINRSDETHNIYRVLLPVKLIKLSIPRGT